MHIRWTQPAARDLTNICDYIEGRSTAATAHRVALAVYQSISSLQKFPHRGRPGRKAGARELVVTNLPYIVIYRVREGAIEIACILHGAQDWPTTP